MTDHWLLIIKLEFYTLAVTIMLIVYNARPSLLSLLKLYKQESDVFGVQNSY